MLPGISKYDVVGVLYVQGRSRLTLTQTGPKGSPN